MTHLLKLKQDHHRTMRPLQDAQLTAQPYPVDCPLTRWPAVRRALRTVTCPSVCILPSNGISADLGCRNAIYWEKLKSYEILRESPPKCFQEFTTNNTYQHVHVHGCTRSKSTHRSELQLVFVLMFVGGHIFARTKMRCNCEVTNKNGLKLTPPSVAW